jgi:micrococcal nuclease
MEHSGDTRARSRARARLAAVSVTAALLFALVAAGVWQLATAPRPSLVAKPDPPIAYVASNAFTQVTVARVVDGDTIHVTMPDGTDETVRFIGVNTPESTTRHEPYGEEASAYAKSRLPKGLTVWLELDARERDKYGRLLAYVWLAPPSSDAASEVRAKMFNAQLLLEGYAQLMTIPPDVRYVDVFTPMQAEAREADKGLWALPAK